MPERSVFTIGREPKSDAVLQHGSVSRRHAELCVATDGSLRLRDLGSSHGTFVHRAGAWVRIVDDELVGAGEPVMFGKLRTTLARVFEILRHDDKTTASRNSTAAVGETQKQAVVLIADVAGFTRMMADDPKGAYDALRLCRRDVIDPTILHHRGRIFKETGDGVLSEFRKPVDALRCANEIQRALPERRFGRAGKTLQFRMGIHFGQAIADHGDLFGDAVNVAERLQRLASPGRICISGIIRDELAKRMSFQANDLGEKTLKNIPYPVQVYEIVPGQIAHRRRRPKAR